jgi:BolA family transcriptional regulator, general stress-responsive regulator
LYTPSEGPTFPIWQSIEFHVMSRKTRIEATLGAALAPLHLEVLDESHRHNVPPGAESHFKVLIVSEGFAADRPLTRHRRVNSLLAGEFQAGLHALAIHAWTPQEWFARGGAAPESPPCLGGSKAS